MNKQLFLDCLLHKEQLIDPFYCSEQLIISRGCDSPPTAIMQLWAQVRDRITAADLAMQDDDAAQFARHVEHLDVLLAGTSANFLEITSFFPALDVSYSMYRKLSLSDRLEFLQRAVVEFIEKRHRPYLSHGYSPVTIQVRRDFEKHKSGGSSAKRKLEALLGAAEYVHARTLDDFAAQSHCFVHADSELFDNRLRWMIREGLAFQWRFNHQGKLPDVLIRRDSHFYICECKHMKEGGGGQDKQLAELIDLVRYAEPNFGASGFSASYVSFLDGVLFNELANPRTPKMRAQRAAIESALESNSENYFLNTWGFQQLIARR